MAKCKWCEQGVKLTEKGEHWIVKSILPAHIKIVKCKNFVAGPAAITVNEIADSAEVKP